MYVVKNFFIIQSSSDVNVLKVSSPSLSLVLLAPPPLGPSLLFPSLRSSRSVRGDLPTPRPHPPERQCHTWGALDHVLITKIPPSLRTSSQRIILSLGCHGSVPLKYGAHTGDEDSRGADAQLFFFKTSASLCFPSGGRHPQQPGRPVREERKIQGGGAPVQEGAGDQGEGRSEVGQHQQHPHYIISLHGKT